MTTDDWNVDFFSERYMGTWQGRGDRSVFFSSHRPVHCSRALCCHSGSSYCVTSVSCRTRSMVFVHPPTTPVHLPCLWTQSLRSSLLSLLSLDHSGHSFCIVLVFPQGSQDSVYHSICSPRSVGISASSCFPRVHRTASITRFAAHALQAVRRTRVLALT